MFTEEKYQIMHMFHMGLILQITSIRGANVLRSACTMSCIKDCRQSLTGLVGYNSIWQKTPRKP
jgi:hypothetical protein